MEMIEMTPQGDTKYQWNVNDPREAEQARALFAQFRSKGYAVFRAKGNGRRGEPVQEFDPDAETMIFVPLMAGG